jgi:hypothetical protein
MVRSGEGIHSAGGVVAGSDGEVVEEGLHFAGGVGVVGAVGGGDAFVEAGDGFCGAALFGEGLGGHLVGGDVGGVVLDEGGEFCEGEVDAAVAEVFHGEAVAGEGVGGIELEDFVEGGDLVHELMVRFGGEGWQAEEDLTRICTDDTDKNATVIKGIKADRARMVEERGVWVSEGI